MAELAVGVSPERPVGRDPQVIKVMQAAIARRLTGRFTGTHMAQRNRPTLEDVGRLAGVDASVASRVLRGDTARVRPETHDRIVAAAQQLGYRPHAAARALSIGRTNTIGVISPSLTAPGYANMIGGIESAAADLGYVVLWLRSAGEEASVVERIDRLADRVDGIIMASARGNGQATDALAKSGIPYILLNRSGGDAHPSVIGDDTEGARLAAAHLISLGHSRIALVSGSLDVDTIVRRRLGFLRAFEDARLPIDEDLTWETDLSEEASAKATREMLTSDNPPTAVFFATIGLALGGLKAVREMRIAVPDELSIVSFDETPLIEYLAVPLTAVRMPHAEMGDQAIRALVDHLETGTRLTSQVVAERPELVVRYSTRPLRSPERTAT